MEEEKKKKKKKKPVKLYWDDGTEIKLPKATKTDLVYEFILAYVHYYLYAPSVREIMVGVGLKSTSATKYHIDRLVAKGKIEVHGVRRIKIKGYRVMTENEYFHR